MGFRGSEILWRIISSIFSYPEEESFVELPEGFRMIFKRSEWTSFSIYKGQYELEIQQVLPTMNYQNARVILDVGANLGWTTYCMGQRKEKIETIHMFEPIPELARNIVDNLENLEATPIVHEVALSNFSGKTQIYYSNMETHNGLATLRAMHDQQCIQERCVRVDTLDNCSVHIQDKIAVLKIDAEGSEMKILLGAKKLLDRNPPLHIILEFTRDFYETDDLCVIRDILKKYRCYSLNSEGKFRRQLKLREMIFEDLVSTIKQQNILLTLRQSELSE
jgi:FkbM family methyltransferase